MTVIRRGIITKQHSFDNVMSGSSPKKRMGAFDQYQTNRHQGNHLDWAPQALCPAPPHPLIHGQSVEQCMSLFLQPQRKRRVITWLYMVMMHKLHLTSFLECVDWRTSSYNQIWTNPGVSHFGANAYLGG